MARTVRVEYAGAVYHVMCRGNNGDAIFMADRDRDIFLKTLGESCDQTGWIVHAFVLMDNHYHILLETPEANLVAGMKWLQGTYTQRFNSVNRRRGHLFQGRYKSLIIDPEEDSYFSTVSSYIHLNPVRAKLCSNPSLYKWSSCRYFSNRRIRKPKWLRVERVMSSVSARNGNEYAAYINQRTVDELDPDRSEELLQSRRVFQRGWVMGDAAFRDEMLDFIKNKSGDNLRGVQRKMHGEHQAELYIERALKSLCLKESDLLNMKCVQPEKQAIVWMLKKHTIVTAIWIAERLQMGHRINISRSVNAFSASSDMNHARLKEIMLQCSG